MIEKMSFKPESSLTFKTVRALRSSLFKALLAEDSDVFSIDLGAITHCDSAGLALLIEARKLCNQKNKRLEVLGMSAQMQSLAEFCGVNGIY